MNEEQQPPPDRELPPSPAQTGVEAPHPSGTTADERLWATFVHLSALLGCLLSSWMGGLGIFLGPLIIWLIKRETMPFVDDQGKEALNFNITIALIALVLVVATFATLGLGLILTAPLALALFVYWLIFTIIGAIRANEGVAYRYPVTLRMIS